MTDEEKLKAAEKWWLDSSDEEEFYFKTFKEPRLLRRSKKITGALASLVFGGYYGMAGEWVENNQAVWLGMVVSDVPGHGGQLLDFVVQSLSQYELSIIGNPSPLKPRDWDDGRLFDYKQENLIHWYQRHGFEVIQSGSETRIVQALGACTSDVTFMLKK